MLLEKIKQRVASMVNRNNYYINILRVLSHFQEERSALVPQIYKIMLLYFSLRIYCLRSEDPLYQLEHKQNFLIDRRSVDDMEQNMIMKDRNELATLLREMKTRVYAGSLQINNYILKKIIVDILNVKDPAEVAVLNEFNILNDIKKKDGEILAYYY